MAITRDNRYKCLGISVQTRLADAVDQAIIEIAEAI